MSKIKNKIRFFYFTPFCYALSHSLLAVNSTAFSFVFFRSSSSTNSFVPVNPKNAPL